MPLLFKRHNVSSKNEILLSYEGELTFDLIHDFIADVEGKIAFKKFSHSSKKKIFNVLVEVLQNLVHNVGFEEADFELKKNCFEATFKVWIEKDKCFVATGNYILKNKVSDLASWLEEINGLDKEGVRKKLREVMDDGKRTANGGGGLGFLDITKRTGHRFFW